MMTRELPAAQLAIATRWIPDAQFDAAVDSIIAWHGTARKIRRALATIAKVDPDGISTDARIHTEALRRVSAA